MANTFYLKDTGTLSWNAANTKITGLVGGGLSVSAGTSIYFDTNNIQRMMIDADGNVGIGTSTDLSHKLEVNGTFLAKNHAWKITAATPGNQTYNYPDIYFTSGLTVTETWNGATTSPWGTTTGEFTIPSTGLYAINLDMFIQYAYDTRWSEFFVKNSAGFIQEYQFVYFKPAITSESQRSWSINRWFNTGDYFYFRVHAGTVALYIATGHTVLWVSKIC